VASGAPRIVLLLLPPIKVEQKRKSIQRGIFFLLAAA
jgi:hypothetical protein